MRGRVDNRCRGSLPNFRATGRLGDLGLRTRPLLPTGASLSQGPHRAAATRRRWCRPPAPVAVPRAATARAGRPRRNRVGRKRVAHGWGFPGRSKERFAREGIPGDPGGGCKAASPSATFRLERCEPAREARAVAAARDRSDRARRSSRLPCARQSAWPVQRALPSTATRLMACPLTAPTACGSPGANRQQCRSKNPRRRELLINTLPPCTPVSSSICIGRNTNRVRSLSDTR